MIFTAQYGHVKNILYSSQTSQIIEKFLIITLTNLYFNKPCYLHAAVCELFWFQRNFRLVIDDKSKTRKGKEILTELLAVKVDQQMWRKVGVFWSIRTGSKLPEQAMHLFGRDFSKWKNYFLENVVKNNFKKISSRRSLSHHVGCEKMDPKRVKCMAITEQII